MNTLLFRAATFGFALAALGGCASTGGMFGEAAVKPTSVVVADFVVAPEVDAIDRGFSTRMDRKDPNFPILERKRRTLSRVNDEIVASIVATIREAGLDAQPGSEEGLSANEKVALLSGRLHGETNVKGKPVGFGPGHAEVAADMTIDYVAGGARKRLTGFTADAKDSGKPPNKKVASARDAAINAVLTSEKDTVKLSPDVEAQARRLGRAIGEKVVAYAKAQGWIAAPEAANVAAEAVKLPEPRPEQKPESKSKLQAGKPTT
jgi:hypothetical protein